MNKTGKKREREKKVVSFMIRLYCKKHHAPQGGLCPSCARLEQYAHERSDHCPFMEEKTFCSNCKTHCYKSDMRQEIRQVMRFSGPRMILYHPAMALCHLIQSKKEKSALKKQGGMP